MERYSIKCTIALRSNWQKLNTEGFGARLKSSMSGMLKMDSAAVHFTPVYVDAFSNVVRLIYACIKMPHQISA